MSSLKLNNCGDLAVENNRLVLVSGADAIRQRWLIHVTTVLGEWFLDQEIGVPFINVGGAGLAVTEKQITPRRLQEIFNRATLEVPGVLRVNSVIVESFDAATRTARVRVYATIDAEQDSQEFVYDGTCS